MAPRCSIPVQILILVLLFDFLYGLQSDLFFPKYSQRTVDYSNAVNTFLLNTERQYYELIVQADEQNKEMFKSINEVLTESLKNISSYVHTLSINDLSDRKSLRNVIFLDGYPSFLKLYPYLERHGKNEAGNYLFVLFLEPGKDYYNIMKNIMKKMYERNLQKIVILVRSADNTSIMELYTFHLYTKTYCGKIIPVRINRFINGKLEVPMKFPILRCQNLHKCTINVFSWDIPPFMMFGKEATLEKNTLNFTGFEGEILKIVAKKLNFTIKLVTDPDFLWGQVYSKENSTGPFELLRNRTIDVHLGYVVHGTTRVSYFEFSHSYYLTNLIAIVKRRIATESHYWIFEPFKIDTWLLLFLCFLVLLIFLYKCTSQKNRTSACLAVLAELLGMPFRMTSKNLKVYYIFPILGICFLVLRSAYMGKIYDSFNIVHFRKPPATISDLILQNYTIFTVRPYEDLVSGRIVPKNAKDYSSGIEVLEMLEKSPSDKNFASLVSEPRFIYFAMEKNLHELFEPIHQPASKHNFCAYFTVGSCISNSFNKMVLRLLSSGIIDKWVIHFHADSSSYAQFRRNILKFKEPMPLSLDKLGLVFLLLVIGLAVALVVFIREII